MSDNNVVELSQSPLPRAIEQLIDEIEDAGVYWYILGGNAQIGTFIAFDTTDVPVIPAHVQRAMATFNHKYKTSQEIREAVFEYAVLIGAVYREMGNEKPVWRLEGTVQ